MNNIKILKSQSLLQEVLQEIFFELEDNRLNTLSIVRVECSRGKESAKVFIDSANMDENEKKEIRKILKKANGIIRQYLQQSLSWYKVPILSYDFDDEMERINKLESLFKQIHSTGQKQ